MFKQLFQSVNLAALLAFSFMPAWSAGLHVSEQALMAHVQFLASDELEGREAGSRGDAIAEKYVASCFMQAGLKTLPGLKEYKQVFGVLESTLDRKKTFLSVMDGGVSRVFHADKEVFYSLHGHEEADIEGEVIFAGFGISAPEYDYDDYDSIDVKGKIVLILNHEPGEKSNTEKFRGSSPTRYMNPRVKIENARRHGAVGVIIVNDEKNGHQDLDKTLMRRYGEAMKKPFMALAGAGETIPLFYATKPVLESLLSKTGIDLNEIQGRIDEFMKPVAMIVPGKKVRMVVRIASTVERKTANIIGFLEGDDSDLKDEFVMVSAHHDHLGVGSKGDIYHGADDNASGTAGLLEAARIMSGVKHSRSLLFVSFCGEEKGVLGSTYFADNLPVDKLRAVLNLDMIGRNNMDKQENENMFIVFCSGQTPMLGKIARRAAVELGFDVRVAPYLHFRGASDHAVFHEMGIPVIFYFSGYHYDYHEPTDIVGKISSVKMKKIVNHISRVLPSITDAGDDKLLFDRSITTEPLKDKYEKPY